MNLHDLFGRLHATFRSELKIQFLKHGLANQAHVLRARGAVQKLPNASGHGVGEIRKRTVEVHAAGGAESTLVLAENVLSESDRIRERNDHDLVDDQVLLVGLLEELD